MNDIKERIKKYFFLHPTERLRVRQVERAVKAPLPSVIRYLKDLCKENTVTRSIIAGVTFYSANRTAQEFLSQKRLFNVEQLFSSGLLDYLRDEYYHPTIVVFGSYARGEDIEKSDIDLYIETPSQKRIALEKFERRLERKIQLFQYESLHKIENKELANNIINGIVLHGFLEVFL